MMTSCTIRINPVYVFFILLPLYAVTFITDMDIIFPFLGGFLKVIAIFATLLLWYRNSIVIQNDTLVLNSFLLSSRANTFSIPSNSWRWKTIPYAQVPLEKVTDIHVTTTTPLIPDRTSLHEINWRDRVTLHYQTDRGKSAQMTVELFIFPQFKKIVEQLHERNPNIPIQFRKVSAAENLQG